MPKSERELALDTLRQQCLAEAKATDDPGRKANLQAEQVFLYAAIRAERGQFSELGETPDAVPAPKSARKQPGVINPDFSGFRD